MKFLVDERQVLGFGSEAIGTDAGQAFHLKPPYPCHYYMHGSGRFGLQCLTNLDLLAADRRGHHRRAAEDQGRQRQPVARAGAGAGSRLRAPQNGAQKAVTAPRRKARTPEEAPMSVADIFAAFPARRRTLPTMLQRQARRYGEPSACSRRGDASWSFEEAPAHRGALCRHAGGRRHPTRATASR